MYTFLANKIYSKSQAHNEMGIWKSGKQDSIRLDIVQYMDVLYIVYK